MNADDFLQWLFERVPRTNEARLTLTAIHPTGNKATPSRHIALTNSIARYDALNALQRANVLGWGAYYAVGLRQAGLGRWRRGGIADVLTLPALYVDIDNPAFDLKLPQTIPKPSCIVHSGGGFHLYWKLKTPLNDLMLAGKLLRALAQHLNGDHLSVAQSLRLPDTLNTKPHRGTRCQVIQFNECQYTPDDFKALQAVKPNRVYPLRAPPLQHNDTLNTAVIDVVTHHFQRENYRKRGDWLNGTCIYPQHHQHEDRNPSFGFNTRTGYGYCHRCGSILLKDICHQLHIQPADYGGLFTSYERKIA